MKPTVAVLGLVTAICACTRVASPGESELDAGRRQRDGGIWGVVADQCPPLQGEGCSPDQDHRSSFTGYCCLNPSAQTFKWWKVVDLPTPKGIEARFLAHRTPEGGPFKYWDVPLDSVFGVGEPSFQDSSVTRQFREMGIATIRSGSATSLVTYGEGMRSATIPLRYGAILDNSFLPLWECREAWTEGVTASGGETDGRLFVLFRADGGCFPDCIQQGSGMALFTVDVVSREARGPVCLKPDGANVAGYMNPLRNSIFAQVYKPNTPPQPRLIRLDELGNVQRVVLLPDAASSGQLLPLPDRDVVLIREFDENGTPRRWLETSVEADGGTSTVVSSLQSRVSTLDSLTPVNGEVYAIGRPDPSFADPNRWWLVVRMGLAPESALIPLTNTTMKPQVVFWKQALYVVQEAVPEGGYDYPDGTPRPNVILFKRLEFQDGGT